MIVTMREIGSRDPTPVGNLLGVAVPALAERLLEARIRREWRQLIGPEIARRCRPGELRNGALELIVDNSPWLHELVLREAELLSRLSDRYGSHAVRTLRLSVGTLGPEPAGLPGHARTYAVGAGARRGSSGRPEERLSPEEAEMIEAAVTPIRHAELQVAARCLLEKALIAARARTAS